MKSVLIVGSTGLVGSYLLKALESDPRIAKIYSLSRKDTPLANEKTTHIKIDFDKLNLAQIPKIDIAYCCLGTTIKSAGSKEAFKKVDFDYVLSFAQKALSAGAETFCLISALGADPASTIFYNEIKGKIENEIKKLGFKNGLIFQPSLLLGQRAEFRFGEKIAQLMSPLMSPFLIGSLKDYKPIPAETVAHSMLMYSLQSAPEGAFQIISNKQMHELNS
jgi:uncharacterized protein YbjT (DUF2867 family)